MTMKTSILIALALTACQGDGDLPAYYDGGPAPAPAAISQFTESGNVGGDVVTISGSGFGGDHDSITVVFGSQNAEILSVNDSELVVRVPQGPIHGGQVAVRVATPGGQGVVPGGYTYDVGSILDDQVGYILINEQWDSCYGGIGKGTTGGCNEIAYNGFTGLEGSAAFFDGVPFPNFHSMYIGWAGGSDMSFGKWTVQTPGQMANSFDMESAMEDMLFKDVPGFSLKNKAWNSTSLQQDEDRMWCSQISQFDRYRYGGSNGPGGYMAPFEITGEGAVISSEMNTSLLNDVAIGDQVCDPRAGQRDYDRSELTFCQTHESDKPNTYMYKADWPVGRNFMGRKGTRSSGEAYFDENRTSDIEVRVPSIGLNADVKFPPPIRVYGTTGFETGGDASLWSLVPLGNCGDIDGEDAFSLDDTAARFQWFPYEGDYSVADGDCAENNTCTIKDVRSYVRVTMHAMDLGWFGGIGSSIRASIVVPDDHGFDAETQMSTLDVPASVLYQFPHVDSQWGNVNSLGGTQTLNWGNPLDSGYGYLIVALDRVTEYAIQSRELGGTVVVAHASGDFAFMNWDNPLLDTDDCGDCSDNDGDGWVDNDDPDCVSGDNEDNAAFGTYTCNDGIDNDSDGRIDADDSDCTSGRSPESPECGDEIDNDGDGWTDSEDPDCSTGAGIFEDNATYALTSCNDGIDSDGDGWVDAADPSCESAENEEVDGFIADVECNDGIDNDGNGDIDSDDTLCVNTGATGENEQNPLSSRCDDGLDNDGDGYTDGKDPDCEFTPFRNESREFRDPEEFAGIDECYDGIDNDLDGAVDAADPGCWDTDGTPNGFINDESRALYVPSDDDDELTDTGAADTGL